jgi:hypothetical protein
MPYWTIVMPSWSQCSAKMDAKEKMTALEEFIYDNEPAGPYAESWRASLAILLENEVNEVRRDEATWRRGP